MCVWFILFKCLFMAKHITLLLIYMNTTNQNDLQVKCPHHNYCWGIHPRTCTVSCILHQHVCTYIFLCMPLYTHNATELNMPEKHHRVVHKGCHLFLLSIPAPFTVIEYILLNKERKTTLWYFMVMVTKWLNVLCVMVMADSFHLACYFKQGNMG